MLWILRFAISVITGGFIINRTRKACIKIGLEPGSCKIVLNGERYTYDIVIIGTGISGVSCAYWLRKLYPVERFPRILLLEKNKERARQLLTWIQDSITTEQLRDPGVPGVKWFNTFLKKNRFLSETGKPLLPRYLRKLGAVFAVVLHGAKNLSEAMTIASEALWHSPDNHASPAKNYTIISYCKRGQPYDQAKAIKIFDEN